MANISEGSALPVNPTAYELWRVYQRIHIRIAMLRLWGHCCCIFTWRRVPFGRLYSYVRGCVFRSVFKVAFVFALW